MNKDALSIICCPICKGDLKLKIIKEEEKEIIEGTLTCNNCECEYVIEEGIPSLLPK